MGREVRRVSEFWKHPRSESTGLYVPLHGHPYSQELRDWETERAQWDSGSTDGFMAKDRIAYKRNGGMFSDWHGRHPDPDEHMPEWPEAEQTHCQMYESTSEGTPVSPVMDTPEELARWCADNKVSTFGTGSFATYEQWLAVCRDGFAPSFVITDGVMMSGVEACDMNHDARAYARGAKA